MPVRELYNRIVPALGSPDNRFSDSGSAFEDGILRLPESGYDDSNHRDYYVMMALAVLYYSVKVGITDSGEDKASEIKLLNEAVENLALQLELQSPLAKLRAEICRWAPIVDAGGFDAIESVAKSMSAAVSGALDGAADRHGWPRDRVVAR